jgi:hypothetical protein
MHLAMFMSLHSFLCRWPARRDSGRPKSSAQSLDMIRKDDVFEYSHVHEEIKLLESFFTLSQTIRVLAFCFWTSAKTHGLNVAAFSNKGTCACRVEMKKSQ